MKNVVRLQFLKNRIVGVSPLLIFGLCGLVCVLVDLDHPLSVFLQIPTKRFLHSWYLLGSSIILCGVIACFGGLLARDFLKNETKYEIRKLWILAIVGTLVLFLFGIGSMICLVLIALGY